MSRKQEIKEAEDYALSQLRALIGNALECDVDGMQRKHEHWRRRFART